MRRLFPVLALTCAVAALAQKPAPESASVAPAWKVLYMHDEDDSSLQIQDLAWPGDQCMVAVGVLQTRQKKPQAAAVRSADGGKTWVVATTSRAFFRSLHFLNQRLGWAVTEEGLARTSDCGATWEPLARDRNIVRIHFTDEAHGIAIGALKKIWSTRDGGRSLTELRPQVEPKADPKRSLYNWVDFLNETVGVIVGFHQPQRASRRSLPAWMDPEMAQLDRQLPALTLMLQTNDGGVTWVGSSSSLLGRVSRVRMAPRDQSLLLVEFEDTFEWPSEVYRVAAGSQAMERVFREKNRAITDVMQSGGQGYLAGYQPVGGAVRMPVPGPVRILRSTDLKLWEEMAVDYRAVAGRVLLARGPRYALIAATDTGMILAPR